MMPLHKFQQIRHVHQIVEKAKDSWWVYRRTIGYNGTLSTIARVVFFARSKDAIDSWMTKQS